MRIRRLRLTVDNPERIQFSGCACNMNDSVWSGDYDEPSQPGGCRSPRSPGRGLRRRCSARPAGDRVGHHGAEPGYARIGGSIGALDRRGLGLSQRSGQDGFGFLAKLVFLDSTNLAVGPTSRVVLDRFVYEGDLGAQKVSCQSRQRHLSLHHRRPRQEGLYDRHADGCDRRPRHGARHRRAFRVRPA